MTETRDYVAWHDAYDDPGSTLSWRLGRVRAAVAAALDEREGPVRVVSVCAGDGRDVLGVLADRPDADRVTVTLLEIEPQLADRARRSADQLPAAVEVRRVDAGTTDSYTGAVPADVVLLVGVLGNLADDDVHHLLSRAPGLCAPGATLVWTRGRGADLRDLDAPVREALREAGFTEVAHETLERGSRPTVGVARYDGGPVPLPAGERLFTFVR